MKIRVLKSFATLKAGKVYTVGKALPDGTMRLLNGVYIQGPSACVNYKQGIWWEYVQGELV